MLVLPNVIPRRIGIYGGLLLLYETREMYGFGSKWNKKERNREQAVNLDWLRRLMGL